MVEADRITANAVIANLTSIVGDRHVLTGEDVSARFDTYPTAHPMKALCIVRPANTAQVAAVLRYCNDAGLKVTAQGGRTSLVQGAKTQSGDIALSFERMTHIGIPDARAGTLEVEAGAPLQAVQEAAAQAGLIYPVDLGARGSATIGGTIATNAGGNSVLRYGMTREQVLGLEVILADGTVLSNMNRMIKNNAGYDLKQVFVGSEGTLGIVTRAMLRLRPDPGPHATAWVGVNSFESVLSLLQLAARESNGCLSSFEVMWSEFLGTVLQNQRHRRPLADDYRFNVLIDVAALNSQDLLQNIVESAWNDGLIADAIIATNDTQAAALWALRDDIETLVEQLGPVFMYDVSLPQTVMEHYVDSLRQQLNARWADASLVVFGHIADGNLHLFVNTGSQADHAEVDKLAYELLRPFDGSISAEHGIGLEKRAYLDVSRTSAEIALMRRFKSMMDPKDTLNPGKVVSLA